jgi:hypothetical protein
VGYVECLHKRVADVSRPRGGPARALSAAEERQVGCLVTLPLLRRGEGCGVSD